jgi:hypothetical protein
MVGPGATWAHAPADATTLLRRAAFLAGFYSRSADGLVANPETAAFTLSGIVERANCICVKGGSDDPNRPNVYMRCGNPQVLAEAKRRLCRLLRTVHLDLWEANSKPSSGQVRHALEQAAV